LLRLIDFSTLFSFSTPPSGAIMIRNLSVLILMGFVALVGCNRPTARDAATPSDTDGDRSDLSALLPKGEIAEHPTYRQWKAFPVGTSLTQQTTTDSAKTPGKTVTVIRTTLKEKGADFLVLESQSTTTYGDGRKNEVPAVASRIPSEVRLPEGMSAATWGKPKGKVQEEEVTMAGKKYRTRKYDSRGSTDAGELLQTVWTCDEIPGGLVKSMTLVPAVEETTVIEITEVKIP
jgi:hypothetical protein